MNLTFLRRSFYQAFRLRAVSLAPVLLLLTLAGCDGSDRGCFGFCAKRDDDEELPASTVGQSADVSCYLSGRTVARADVLPYATDATAEQVLRFSDSVRASSTAPRPLLLWFTGDTFESATSVADAPILARAVAEIIGAHFAVASYRQSDTADWPAQIIDVKTAIRFLKAQNESQNFNIDLENIYIGGDQAGATLAALAAYSTNFSDFEPSEFPEQTDRPDLLITFGGVYDFDTLLADNDNRITACADIAPNIDELAIRSLFDCPPAVPGAAPLSECDIDELRDASPVQQLGPSSPQALFYHGALDCQIPVAQSEELDARYGAGGEDTLLRSNGIFTELPNDDQRLASLTALAVLENLVEFPDFDCDDDT